MDVIKHEPFADCERKGCRRDLGRGVLISELECCDGLDRFSGIHYAGFDPPLSEAA